MDSGTLGFRSQARRPACRIHGIAEGATRRVGGLRVLLSVRRPVLCMPSQANRAGERDAESDR
ncbi:hypothetical protein OF001_U180033 [Pseudomonas sp. OF001]|nr:hypothetical protein OF001_U180033 [Pseudomonas sp. OF001]